MFVPNEIYLQTDLNADPPELQDNHYEAFAKCNDNFTTIADEISILSGQVGGGFAHTLTSITGGSSSLDGIDGAVLADGDTALVVTATSPSRIYMYRLDASSGATADAPYIVTPTSNAGTKRWILAGRVPRLWNASRDPLVTDDYASGVTEGDIWKHGTSLWVCASSTNGAAVWTVVLTLGSGAANASAGNHNHDSAYSATGHNHDSAYSATGHNHDSAYSATGHNHDSAYSAKTHASGHQTGGADEIDGDKLDIDWNPANYTPEVVTNYADSVDNLTAHMNGIDKALALKQNISSPTAFPSTWYWADISFYAKTVSVAADRYIALTPNAMQIDIGGSSYTLSAQASLDLSQSATWDTTSGTDYRTAANRAGKDFYVYAVQPGSGTVPAFKVSANSTVPSGYDAGTSRKVCGFHCLCVAVGTISGHELTGYVAGDILPRSVWDLKHRSHSNNNGMVYDESLDLWVDIYMASGTGSSTSSTFGATISATRNWMDFADDGKAVKKRMLRDFEFQSVAAGSNEETNIAGSADPGTTGGHSNTASRRMISNIGCEDCCGVLWQWLDEQSTRWDFTTSWGWYDLPGSKGSLYNGAETAGTGDVKLVAGGYWSHGADCGSRARNAIYYRWATFSFIGCRFAARSITK